MHMCSWSMPFQRLASLGGEELIRAVPVDRLPELKVRMALEDCLPALAYLKI